MTREMVTGGPDDGQDKYNQEAAGEGLVDLLEKHAERKRELSEVLESVAENPRTLDQAVEVINYRAGLVANGWHGVLRKLVKEEGHDSGEFIRSIAALWMADDSERVGMLEEMADGLELHRMADGSMEKAQHFFRETVDTVREHVDNNTDLVEEVPRVLATMYADHTAKDITQFIHVLQSATYSGRSEVEGASVSRADALKSLLPRLGAHALDVVKIAGGVSLGIVAGLALRKK